MSIPTPTIDSKKFQRTYTLQIQGQDGTIYQFGSEDGTNLLTLEFTVSRAVMASSQSGTFRIKNLSPDIRNNIAKDWQDTGRTPILILKAGYIGTPLSTVFAGIIFSATSFREEGGVDVITEIEGHDLSLIMGTAFSSWTLASNADPTKQSTIIINKLISDLQAQSAAKGVTLGIGFIGTFTNPAYSYTANGSTWDLLQEQTNRLTYIDNSKIYCLPNGQNFQGDLTLISSKTGLLGTPRRCPNGLVFEMVFEPSLIPGQYVYLDSQFNQIFNSNNNGAYTVLGVQHAGIISNTVSGKCKTSATLYLFGTPYTSTFGIPK